MLYYSMYIYIYIIYIYMYSIHIYIYTYHIIFFVVVLSSCYFFLLCFAPGFFLSIFRSFLGGEPSNSSGVNPALSIGWWPQGEIPPGECPQTPKYLGLFVG